MTIQTVQPVKPIVDSVETHPINVLPYDMIVHQPLHDRDGLDWLRHQNQEKDI